MQQEPQMPPFQQSVNEASSNSIAARSRSPLKFFLLVFVLSIPFWLFGTVTGLMLSPDLPVSSLAAFVSPVTAAATLVYRERGTADVTALLRRSFDYKRIRAKVWYAPIVLLMPSIYVLMYGVMRVMGLPLPTVRFPLPRSETRIRSGTLGHAVRYRRHG